MTVIALKQTFKEVTICADTQVSYWYAKVSSSYDESRKDFAKIIQKNWLTIGTAGLLRELWYMKIFLDTNKPKDATVDSILSFLCDFQEWVRKKLDNTFQMDNHYIIIFEGNSFCCHGFDVYEVEKYCAIWSWREEATAALFLGHTAKKAVEVAIELAYWCGGNVQEITIKR